MTSDDAMPQQALMDAPGQGRFGLLALDHPNDRITTSGLQALGEPYAIVMQVNYGPGRFCSARAVRRWAAFCVVHATQERSEDYRFIANLVDRHGRVLVVESEPGLAHSWLAFLRRERPTIALLSEVAPR